MEIRRITAKDCRVSIAVTVAFLFAVLLSVRTFHLSSFVVKKEIISYHPNLETKHWSPAMLRASRSRVKNFNGKSAAQPLPYRQLQVDGSLARVKRITNEAHSQMDEQESIGEEESLGDEIMVDLFSTSWRELVSLFLSHRFRGIFLYRRSKLDCV